MNGNRTLSTVSQPADNARSGGANLSWFMVAPYGRTPSRSGVQVFDAGSAERLTAAFENAKVKAGTCWRGVPIYIGFPDLDPTSYTDPKKYGAVVELQARHDGLYACARWAPAGHELVANEHYSYVNVLWDTEPDPGQPGIARPVALVSLGLTNAAGPGAQPLVTTGANDANAGVFKTHPYWEAITGQDRPYRDMFFDAVDKEMQSAGTVFNQAYSRCQTTHPSFYQCYLNECEAVKAAKLGQPSSQRLS